MILQAALSPQTTLGNLLQVSRSGTAGPHAMQGVNSWTRA